MANKRRMEQDPSIDPKTGKKRERRLKDDRPRPTITVSMNGSVDTTFFNLDPKLFEQYQEEARRIAQRYAKEGRIKMGGNIFRDGEQSDESSPSVRKIFGSSGPGSSYDVSGWMKTILDSEEVRAIYGVPPNVMGPEVDVLQRHIWQTCMEVWDYPSGIRFTVWRQEAQASTLVHVEYMDPDQEAGALVESTVEFLDEQLEQAKGGPELMLQRELERMKDRCDADMAAFEPDGDEEHA